MKAVTEEINITQAIYVNDYEIKFTFSDGTIKIIDFYPFLTSPHQNPALIPLLWLNCSA